MTSPITSTTTSLLLPTISLIGVKEKWSFGMERSSSQRNFWFNHQRDFQPTIQSIIELVGRLYCATRYHVDPMCIFSKWSSTASLKQVICVSVPSLSIISKLKICPLHLLFLYLWTSFHSYTTPNSQPCLKRFQVYDRHYYRRCFLLTLEWIYPK